ncbi:MAG TPA: response regulator [Candidatus Saccharimonadales bacterium]|nr:response regulator [Candidatus Saccharimonadales bacterium]
MKNLSILAVEDDENDVIFLQMGLKAAGVTCPLHVAVDGRKALDYLEGNGAFSNRAEFPMPYLILLDLKLPQVMGLDVLSWIRARPELDSTIVIVMTSSAHPLDVEAAYRLGTNAFLVKPSNYEGLKVLVQSIKDFWLTHNLPEPKFVERKAQTMAVLRQVEPARPRRSARGSHMPRLDALGGVLGPSS